MNGIRTIHAPEGEKYELNWEGQSKTFDGRDEAHRAMGLHMSKDAGRVLTPEEEALLLTSESSQAAGVSATGQTKSAAS